MRANTIDSRDEETALGIVVGEFDLSCIVDLSPNIIYEHGIFCSKLQQLKVESKVNKKECHADAIITLSGLH